jgi:hypothetical protein
MRRPGNAPGRIEELEAKSTQSGEGGRAATSPAIAPHNARRGLHAQDEVEAGRCKAFPADGDWLQAPVCQPQSHPHEEICKA